MIIDVLFRDHLKKIRYFPVINRWYRGLLKKRVSSIWRKSGIPVYNDWRKNFEIFFLQAIDKFCDNFLIDWRISYYYLSINWPNSRFFFNVRQKNFSILAREWLMNFIMLFPWSNEEIYNSTPPWIRDKFLGFFCHRIHGILWFPPATNNRDPPIFRLKNSAIFVREKLTNFDFFFLSTDWQRFRFFSATDWRIAWYCSRDPITNVLIFFPRPKNNKVR